MMAGLFNYEHAYRKYTRLLLDSFQAQNIQYAEIRPNFMAKNQVPAMQSVCHHRLKVF
jgi:adenosine deaminase CECR1